MYKDSEVVINEDIETDGDVKKEATAVIARENWQNSASTLQENSLDIKDNIDSIMGSITNRTDLPNEGNNALRVFQEIEKIDKCCFICSICCRTFSRKYTLENHLLSHTTVRSHQCLLCNKSYKSKSDLTRHLHSHLQETFNCNICQKAFRSKNLLGDHIRGVHNEEFLQCDVCKKILKSKSGFLRHQKSHLLERPFQCAHCESSFKHKKILQKHLLNHLRRV